jgi:ABC-type molybdate transport system substrate-binding protein
VGPRALVESGKALIGPIPLARNHMCLIAQKSLGVTPDNLLDKMLEPKVRISTSTPIADPGGDYAYAIFDNAEAFHPGATRILKDKALHFMGDPTPPEPGHTATGSLFLRDKIDMAVSYCSGAPALLRELPSLISLPFPKSLDPAPISGIAVLTTKQIAWRLVLFLLSEKGQKLGADAGFEPIAKKLDEAPRP